MVVKSLKGDGYFYLNRLHQSTEECTSPITGNVNVSGRYFPNVSSLAFKIKSVFSKKVKVCKKGSSRFLIPLPVFFKIKGSIKRRQLIFCVVRAVGRIFSGQSVGKIIMLSFRAGTSENNKYRPTRLRMEATTSLYPLIQRCEMY